MALAANVRQYLPPKRIQQMEADLADLAKYWHEGPWGWSLATKQTYRRMGISDSELPSDEWLAEIRQLSSREFACNYIQTLLGTAKAEGWDSMLLGEEMHFTDTLMPQGTFPLIFKSPWSSSGRGVFVANELNSAALTRLKGYVNAQGGYAVDHFYDNKATDFALEFIIHPDHKVQYLGLSVFHAADSGAYGYNYVESQSQLLQRIGVDRNLLQHLIDYHTQQLAHIAYTGPVGIDMIATTDGHIHPVIEINLRMNMGILALYLFNNNIVEDQFLTPDRKHGFVAMIQDKKLSIVVRN